MIIKVLGPSGSGKSTVARAVAEDYEQHENLGVSHRRRPVAVRHARDVRGSLPLFILGHYEIANGGADTIGDLEYLYDLIRTYYSRGDVLYEGLTLTDTADRVVRLAREYPLSVFHLTTPVDVCVERVHARLSPSGKPHRIAPSSIEKMHAKCQRDADKMRAAGVSVTDGDLDQVRTLVIRRLRRGA